MELIGQRFGHIRLIEFIAKGGIGDVYVGYDEYLQRKVAVKVLKADYRLDRDARDRLLREARVLSRIDHLNICRIHEYVETADVDLLVLEYIDGKTLDAASASLSRGQKLRVAIAIAEVLVAAHLKGVIHRDLKPQNVMLTKNGQVKVLDFGLAGWLRGSSGNEWSDRDTRRATLPRDYAVPEGSTATGALIGTPLYMSPEQARREKLTPASDIFSFGLLMQTLFTGRDPHPSDLSTPEIVDRVSRGETDAPIGAPSDVAELITRTKQRIPDERPTAGELLERLKYLSRRPKRFQLATAVAITVLIAIGAWKYTTDLQHERTRAIAAQVEAAKRRGQQEELLEFVVGDIRKKLEPVGRLDILDDAGKRVTAYVDSLDPATTDVDQLTRGARALNELGEASLAQGKSKNARELFQRSLRLADSAVQREPGNAQALLVKGVTHFWIGNGLRLEGDHDEALRHMRAYMKAGDALVTIDPARKDYRIERAYGHSAVAVILQAKGELREALEHYDISLRVKEDLVAENPLDLDAQAEVARAYDKGAVVQYLSGELRDALRRFEREDAAYRTLLGHDPNHIDWMSRLATAMAYRALLLNVMGDNASAVTLWQEELQVEQLLAERDPTNASRQRNVAATERRLAMSAAARRDFANALPLFRSARRRIRGAIEKAPTWTSLLVDEAAIDNDYASALANAGDIEGANELNRSVIKRMDVLPLEDRRARIELARSSYLLGDRLARRSVKGTTELWERAERELAPHVASSKNPMDLDLWMRVLVRRGRIAEARVILTQIRNTGYAVTELETVCREGGC